MFKYILFCIEISNTHFNLASWALVVWYFLGLSGLSVSVGVCLLSGSSDSFKIRHIPSRADVRAQIESSVLQQVKGNMETEDKGSDITGRKK